jgi:hypothetical protein
VYQRLYHRKILRSTGRALSSGGAPVSRHPDPARIDAARREATRRRLLATGILPERADALMAAWESEAERRGISDGGRYATETAWDWMAARRRPG